MKKGSLICDTQSGIIGNIPSLSYTWAAFNFNIEYSFDKVNLFNKEAAIQK